MLSILSSSPGTLYHRKMFYGSFGKPNLLYLRLQGIGEKEGYFDIFKAGR